MIGGSVIGAAGWVSISQLRKCICILDNCEGDAEARSFADLNPVEITDEIALYVHSGIFTLLGLLGMLGFVGSLAKNRGCVVAFSIGIACHLGACLSSFWRRCILNDALGW